MYRFLFHSLLCGVAVGPVVIACVSLVTSTHIYLGHHVEAQICISSFFYYYF